MPFKKHYHITLTNLVAQAMCLYYQINYVLTDVPDERTNFHTQFCRVNPMLYKNISTILDGVEEQGHYIGTYLA
jgi:hypothetical protein